MPTTGVVYLQNTTFAKDTYPKATWYHCVMQGRNEQDNFDIGISTAYAGTWTANQYAINKYLERNGVLPTAVISITTLAGNPV